MDVYLEDILGQFQNYQLVTFLLALQKAEHSKRDVIGQIVDVRRPTSSCCNPLVSSDWNAAKVE